MIAVACAVVLIAAGAFAASRHRWGGGGNLGIYGNGNGLSVATGSPFTIQMTEVRPGHRIQIESVRLHGKTPGVELVGALVQTGSRGAGLWVGERQFPPAHRPGRWQPARGAIIPAHTRMALYVGLRTVQSGDFRQPGVDVFYREHRFGIELRRREHIGPLVAVCAVRTSARLPHCKIPEVVPGRQLILRQDTCSVSVAWPVLPRSSLARAASV